MKVTKTSLERTFNLGSYESLRVGFEAELAEQDNPLNVLKGLEDMAELYLQARTAKPEASKTELPKPKKEPQIDVTGLTWELVQTDNPFEINKDTEHESWKALCAKIAEHKGKPVFIEGYVYWLMRDGFTLARRKK